jgi:hypothetical protein
MRVAPRVTTERSSPSDASTRTTRAGRESGRVRQRSDHGVDSVGAVLTLVTGGGASKAVLTGGGAAGAGAGAASADGVVAVGVGAAG